MNKCVTCKHFRLAPECVKWNTEPEDYRYGACSIKLGDMVEIEFEGDAWLGDVTVGTTFGCMAHEAK